MTKMSQNHENMPGLDWIGLCVKRLIDSLLGFSDPPQEVWEDIV
jgi:hypothetical protein